jgi:serine/threonine protein kinase
MKCPQCHSEVSESADHCFNCGHVLRAQPVLIRGSLVAGRFEILDPLGKGGMGMVYKARDRKLEEVVAIKVLRPEIAADPEMERRFRKEIVLARRVRHRNVCGIHEYGDDGSLRYIAMEYIEGVDLRKVVLETGGLPSAEAFDTCLHTAEGLQAIHDAGIVHRDLKTANLMRDAQGVVRLMDFGIAKQVGGEASAGATATGLIVGTPDYMSPEQARGSGVDHRSDIYALGIVAFELFTGRVPFHGATPLETILKHLHDPPPLEGPGTEALPPSVVPILRKALAKNPDERFSTAAEFAVAIAQARDAAGVAPLARRSYSSRPVAGVGAPWSAGAIAAEIPFFTLETTQPSPTLASRSGAADPPTISESTLAHPVTSSIPIRGPLGVGDSRRREAPPTGYGPRRMLGIAAAVLSVAVGAITLLKRPSEAPSPTPASAPSISVAPSPAVAEPPATGPNGTLVIDAAPWGEVVAVVDSSGRHHEPERARYTPLALALPPGSYSVQVRHPGAAQPLASVATVRSQSLERVSVTFRRVDAREYLQRTGF